MPRKEQHLSKANDNEGFASSLDLLKSINVDWALTALFYAALHYVEAYFATRSIHSVDHRARDSAIQRDPNLRKIFNDYSELKNYSINARYYMYPIKSGDVALLLSRLQAIKSHLSSFL